MPAQAATATNGRREAAPLYRELEDRMLARDQEGGSRVYYELLHRGRPLPEIMAEAVRIHAPYTHVPVPSAHRRRLSEFRQQRPLPALVARRNQSAEDAAGKARRAAARPDDLVHPVGARHLEPEDPEGARPLCDARLQDAERRAAKAGRLLARPGTAQGNGSARRTSQQLADIRRTRSGHRCLPDFPRPDGGDRAPQGGAGPTGLCRHDRCAGPDALQPLLYDRAQGLPRAVGRRDRQCDRLGQCARRDLCGGARHRGRAALALGL